MVLSSIFRKFDDKNGPLLNEVQVSRDKSVNPEDVQDICQSVGWSWREPELIRKALKNSVAVISVWHNGSMVGFARATGDQVFNATIWDMAVRPSYQGQGIGRLVMFEILRHLEDDGIPLVTLYADPGTDGFYRKFGFLSDPSGVRGMFRESLGKD